MMRRSIPSEQYGKRHAAFQALALVCLGVGALSSCLQTLGDVEIVQDDTRTETDPLKAVSCEPGADGEASMECLQQGCSPGARRCRDALLSECGQDGRTWTLVDQCASAALCLEEEGLCLAAACRPLQHRCTDAGTLEICNADLTGFEFREQCATSAHCSAVSGREGCELDACREGRQRCNAAQIEECSSDRGAFVPVGPACASASLCREDGAGRARCEEPVCSPGQYRCSGRQLQRCADERDEFVPVRDCAAPELCRVNLQGCLEPS